MKYPVYQPSLSGNEKKYVNECLDSTWISSKGEFVTAFEKSFAQYLGIKHATTICNGTAALHLALLALEIGPGDEVIVPSLTYIASVNAISYTGATPVFVESLDRSWQMDPGDVEKKITNKTKAILAVHLYGHPCDMDSLVKIVKKNNLFLVEDTAEALGSKYKNKLVGTFGDIAIFSFYGNKTITTGEGGMVVTNNTVLFDLVTRLKGQGLAKDKEYWHDIIGYNYRMTNISAAIGLAQLERIDAILESKRKIAETYIALFANTTIECQKEEGDIYHSYWMFSILLPKSIRRQKFRNALSKSGIETRPLFHPIHTMPMYSNNLVLPITELISHQGINLPSYPELTKEDITYIANQVKRNL